MRIQIVGDLHAQVNNIQDTKAIFSETAKIQQGADQVLFLGDLFHTHQVVRQEVLSVVQENMAQIQAKLPVYVLVGNHDGISPSNQFVNQVDQALYGIKNLTVINPSSLFEIEDGVHALSFHKDQSQFLSKLKSGKILFCHQTFDGAKFENGFYAPDGFDFSGINYEKIISGHIHTQQTIQDKIWYPGTPRQLISSEQNHDKRLFVFDTKQMKVIDSVSTAPFVKCFWSVDADPESEPIIPPDMKPGDRLIVKFTGTKSQRAQVELAYSGISGVTFQFKENFEFSSKSIDIEASGGLDQAIKEYVYEVQQLDDREAVWKTLQEAMKTS